MFKRKKITPYSKRHVRRLINRDISQSVSQNSSEFMRNISEYLSETASNLIRPQSLELSKKFGTISSSEESEDERFLHREPFPETPDLGQPSASKTPDLSSISTPSDVVRLFFPTATDEDLKEPIQTWLRHYKKRLQKRKSVES